MRLLSLFYCLLALEYYRAALACVGGAHEDAPHMVLMIRWLEDRIENLFPTRSV